MMKFNKLVLALGLAVAFCLNAAAQSTGKATLAWDASPDSRVNAYRLYYSQDPTLANPVTVDVPTVPPASTPPTTVTATGLVNGKTYYFAVTALDTVDGLESIFSNQVSAPIPFVPLPQITGLKIISVVAK